MGGLGSGPYGLRGTKQRKWTVEETHRIDIQRLKGLLENKRCTMSWDNPAMSITIYTRTDYIVLSYAANKESMKVKVNIDKTKVGYGERLWFVCPGCGKKTGRLYIVGKHFRCRVCHGLTYFTCQESGDPLDYLALKIRRQQRKLGLDGSDNILSRPEIYELPYFKPKHMHWNTFARERERLELMQLARQKAWLTMCRRYS